MNINHNKLIDILSIIILMALFMGIFAKGIYGADSWQTLACGIVALICFLIKWADKIRCKLRKKH